MTHPYREWDGAYVMGSLSPSERREYERHLSTCAECTAEVASLAGISGILSGVPTEQAMALLPNPPPTADTDTDIGSVTADRSAADLAAAAAGSATAGAAVVGSAPVGLTAAGSASVGSAAAGSAAAGRGVSWEPVPTEVPASLLPKLLESARRSRRRARRRVVALVAAAAAVAAAVALVVPWLLSSPTPSESGQLLAMAQTVPGPITAEATLYAEPWGTRIQVVCLYAASAGGPASGGPAKVFQYALYVTDRSGTDTQVASWSAAAGSRSTPVATTRLMRDQINRIDIRLVDTGLVLLEARP